MLKLELDWAAEIAPDTGVVSDDGDSVIVVVEYDGAPGPAGWPTVRVYASRVAGVPSYREAMALDAWLRDEYGMEDDAERDDLVSVAVNV